MIARNENETASVSPGPEADDRQAIRAELASIAGELRHRLEVLREFGWQAPLELPAPGKAPRGTPATPATSSGEAAGDELDPRDDDREETIRARLGVFERETAPLLDYYRSRGLLHDVDGLGELENVNRRIVGGLAIC